MIVNFNTFKEFEVPLLRLCNADDSYICNINNPLDFNAEYNFSDFSTLSFRIDYQTDKECYENVCVRKEILLGKPLSEYIEDQGQSADIGSDIQEDCGYFIITEVKETKNTQERYKTITAKSCEYELSNIAMPYIGENDDYSTFGSRILYHALDEGHDEQYFINTNDAPSIMWTIKKHVPGWDIQIDSETIDSNDRSLLPTRKFETSDSDTIYGFLMKDTAEAFNCVFCFDIYNRVIHISLQTEAISGTDIYLSSDNLLDSVMLSESEDDRVNAIQVVANNSLSIDGVNPILNGYIYHFTENYDKSVMSDGLWNIISDWMSDYGEWKYPSPSTGLLHEYEEIMKDIYTLNAQISVLLTVKSSIESNRNIARSDRNQTAGMVTLSEDMAEKKDIELSYYEGKKNSLNVQNFNGIIDVYDDQIRTIENVLGNDNNLSSLYGLLKSKTDQRKEIIDSLDFYNYILNHITANNNGTLDDSDIESLARRYYIEITRLLRVYSYSNTNIVMSDTIKFIPNTISINNVEYNVSTIESVERYEFDSDTLSTVSQKISTYNKKFNTWLNTIIPSWVSSIAEPQIEKQVEVMRELYDDAYRVLSRTSQPRCEITIDSTNFLFSEVFRHISEQIKTGCSIHIEKPNGEIVKHYVLKVSVNYTNKDFSITLSNRYRLNDALSIFEDSYGNASSIASITNSHALILEDQKKKIDTLNTYRMQSLNYTKQHILSSENQDIFVDDTGMIVRTIINPNGDPDSTNPLTAKYDSYQFKLANGSILFTEDWWQTAGLAVGKYYDPRAINSNGSLGKWRMGINGEHIMANTIEASSLTIGFGDSASGTNVLKDGSFDGDPDSSAFAWHDDSVNRETITIDGSSRTVEFIHLDTAQSFSFTVSGFALQKKAEYLVAYVRGSASVSCVITHANNSEETVTNTINISQFARRSIIQLPTSHTNEIVDLTFSFTATGQGLDLFGITIGVQNEPFVFSDQIGENIVIGGGFEKALSNTWEAYTYNSTQRKFNQTGIDQVKTNNIVILYDTLQQTPRISKPRQSDGSYAASVLLYSGGDNEDIADVMFCSKSPIHLESGQTYSFSFDISFGETATDRVTSENKTLYVPIHVALMTQNALNLIKGGTMDFDELLSYQACLELFLQERQYYCDYKYSLSNGFTAQLNGASNFFNNDLYLVFYFKFADGGFVEPDSLSSMYAFLDKVSITKSDYAGSYNENSYNTLSGQSFSAYGIPSATIPLISTNGYDGGSMLTVSQNHDISSDMFRVFGSLPYYISAYVIGSGQINIRWYSSEIPSSLIKTETLPFENVASWERISKKCIAPDAANYVSVCLISNSTTASFDGVLLEQSAFLNAYSDHIS